jgi:hypothetical protein
MDRPVGRDFRIGHLSILWRRNHGHSRRSGRQSSQAGDECERDESFLQHDAIIRHRSKLGNGQRVESPSHINGAQERLRVGEGPVRSKNLPSRDGRFLA